MSFESYLVCARGLGVDLEGPFADSLGHGAIVRASSPPLSSSDRRRVMHGCPQGAVGFALTPDRSVPARAVERALTVFTRCVDSHGYPALPLPKYGDHDPVIGLIWPLDWQSPTMLSAAKSCVGPLRALLLGS